MPKFVVGASDCTYASAIGVMAGSTALVRRPAAGLTRRACPPRGCSAMWACPPRAGSTRRISGRRRTSERAAPGFMRMRRGVACAAMRTGRLTPAAGRSRSWGAPKAASRARNEGRRGRGLDEDRPGALTVAAIEPRAICDAGSRRVQGGARAAGCACAGRAAGCEWPEKVPVEIAMTPTAVSPTVRPSRRDQCLNMPLSSRPNATWPGPRALGPRCGRLGLRSRGALRTYFHWLAWTAGCRRRRATQRRHSDAKSTSPLYCGKNVWHATRFENNCGVPAMKTSGTEGTGPRASARSRRS